MSPHCCGCVIDKYAMMSLTCPSILSSAGISSSRTESAPSSVDSATKRGKYPILRSSLSLSLTLLLYRLLFRFLSRLRAALLHRPAEPFRRRNPRITAALTSVYAPSVGASLAGLALGIFPSGGGGGGGGKVVVKGAGCRGRGASSGGDNKLRRAIALYALFRAGEFAWDLAEREGWVWGWEAVKKGAPSVSMAVATAAAGVGEKGATATTVMVKRERPWWFGSWLLQPLAFAQLLDAVVFERDCFPVVCGSCATWAGMWTRQMVLTRGRQEYGNFIFSNSPSYIHPRPPNYPAHLKWPSAYEVVDGLRDMAKLKWP